MPKTKRVAKAKSKVTKKAITPKAKITKVKKLDTAFSITGVSAQKIILAQYVQKSSIVDYDDDPGTLPQTIIDTDNSEYSITDLLMEKSKRVYYFLDSRKSQIKLWPTMIDITSLGVLPKTTTKACWWDRHPFTTHPIGCPLHYYDPTIPSLSRRYTNAVAETKKTKEKIFETEGYFCSLSCCKAYILNNRNNSRYKESLALLTMLTTIWFGKIIPGIPIAPSWKIIKGYGGHLTIQEYRASIGLLDYTETPNMKRSNMVSSSQYIIERRQKPT